MAADGIFLQGIIHNEKPSPQVGTGMSNYKPRQGIPPKVDETVGIFFRVPDTVRLLSSDTTEANQRSVVSVHGTAVQKADLIHGADRPNIYAEVHETVGI